MSMNILILLTSHRFDLEALTMEPHPKSSIRADVFVVVSRVWASQTIGGHPACCLYEFIRCVTCHCCCASWHRPGSDRGWACVMLTTWNCWGSSVRAGINRRSFVCDEEKSNRYNVRFSFVIRRINNSDWNVLIIILRGSFAYESLKLELVC